MRRMQIQAFPFGEVAPTGLGPDSHCSLEIYVYVALAGFCCTTPKRWFREGCKLAIEFRPTMSYLTFGNQMLYIYDPIYMHHSDMSTWNVWIWHMIIWCYLHVISEILIYIYIQYQYIYRECIYYKIQYSKEQYMYAYSQKDTPRCEFWLFVRYRLCTCKRLQTYIYCIYIDFGNGCYRQCRYINRLYIYIYIIIF